MIDCQQTNLEASHHWPFTEEYNKQGIIKGDEVVLAINDSGAEQVLLAFELRCSAYYPQEDRFLDNLKDSINYWRKWVKD